MDEKDGFDMGKGKGKGAGAGEDVEFEEEAADEANVDTRLDNAKIAGLDKIWE